MSEVSWARPIIRAERALAKFADLMESGKGDAAADQLAEAQRQIALAAEFMVANSTERDT